MTPTSSPSCSLCAVGDLQLGDSSICVGFGLRSRYPTAHDLDRLFASLRPALSGDLVFGNLETTLGGVGDDGVSWEAAQMRGIPGYAAALARAGFNVLNVANNHAVQHGHDNFAATVAALREHGIAPCGLRGTPPWCSEPVRLSCAGGARVGLLAYCIRPRQYAHDVVPPFAEGTRDEITADVARLRSTVDAVIVSLHWGEEFVPLPADAEIEMAEAIIAAGASAILGHHPHVARPVVLRDGALIAFSLGNCAADMIWYEPLRRGLLVRARLEGARVAAASISEVYIDAACRPVPAAESTLPVEHVTGLEQAAYEQAIHETWSAQRKQAYAYAMRNIGRFSPRVLGRLLWTTARNKLSPS